MSTPRATVSAFTRDMNHQQWVDACNLMTRPQQAAIGNGLAAACPASLALGMRFGSGIVGQGAMQHLVDGLASEPITVSGDRAVMQSNRGAVILRRVDGRWLIATGFYF